MKTIINKVPKPVRVPLPGGKTLFLGPLKEGQIAPRAAEHGPVQKLVEEGVVEIFDANHPGRFEHLQGKGPHQKTTTGGVRGAASQGKGDR